MRWDAVRSLVKSLKAEAVLLVALFLEGLIAQITGSGPFTSWAGFVEWVMGWWQIGLLVPLATFILDQRLHRTPPEGLSTYL